MIHAWMFLEKIRDQGDHGPRFQEKMHFINRAAFTDHQARPARHTNCHKTALALHPSFTLRHTSLRAYRVRRCTAVLICRGHHKVTTSLSTTPCMPRWTSTGPITGRCASLHTILSLHKETQALSLLDHDVEWGFRLDFCC